MYYNLEGDYKNTTITTIRIDNDLKQNADDYAKINPEFSLSKFVNDRLKEYFFDSSFINKRISYLKRSLQKEREILEKTQKSSKKTFPKFTKTEITKFLKTLTEKEKIFFIETIKILDRDPSFLMGRYNLYRNKINMEISKRDFIDRINMFQYLKNKDKTKK